MKTLTLMMGVPGSGKSTAVRTMVERDNNIIAISRDDIRFSFVLPNEEYFSKEDLVFDTFITKLAAHLSCGYDVIADATHINQGSRAKLINGVRRKYDLVEGEGSFNQEVECEVCFVNTPLDICLERNEKRAGTRGYVPPEVIKNMFSKLQKVKDCEEIVGILEYNEEGELCHVSG